MNNHDKAQSPRRGRLSVSRVPARALRPLSADELAVLRAAANVLMPGTSEMPSGGSIGDFERRADRAAAILTPRFGDIERGLRFLLTAGSSWSNLRRFQEQDAEGFYWLSLLLVGVYVYSPEVQEVLGYLPPHRDAPDPGQTADEVMSGILDDVISRGPIYVDPGEFA